MPESLSLFNNLITLFVLQWLLFFLVAAVLRFENANMWKSHAWKHVWENKYRKRDFLWISVWYILSGFFEKHFLKLYYLKIICPQFNWVRFKHISGLDVGFWYFREEIFSMQTRDHLLGTLTLMGWDWGLVSRPFFAICCMCDCLWASVYSSAMAASPVSGFLRSLQTQNWNSIFLLYSMS